MSFADFVPSGNQAVNPDLYEVENAALDRRGLLLDAMRVLAPWSGRDLVDLGCGSGYWFQHYTDAASLTGVEPDKTLLPLAQARDASVRVLHGSAECMPLPDDSVDVVHARFAYFFGKGADRGLTEVARVLRPGGALVVVDNDEDKGEFATLLNAAYPRRDAERWWADRGATCVDVMSDWKFEQRADLEAVLRLEFPQEVADAWLVTHPERTSLTYAYKVFRWSP